MGICARPMRVAKIRTWTRIHCCAQLEFAENVNEPFARLIVTTLSSFSWRITSRTSVPNLGNSSKNKTPLRASEIGFHDSIWLMILSLPLFKMTGEPDCQNTRLPLPVTVMLLQEPNRVTVFACPLTITALPLHVKVKV
jgi:hypothetical protein